MMQMVMTILVTIPGNGYEFPGGIDRLQDHLNEAVADKMMFLQDDVPEEGYPEYESGWAMLSTGD